MVELTSLAGFPLGRTGLAGQGPGAGGADLLKDGAQIQLFSTVRSPARGPFQRDLPWGLPDTPMALPV